MDEQQQQLVKRLTEANYILVTVNSNPTFDQLAAAIGLTLMLNKMNKYATAIFSGQVPSSLNFLSPEKTIEKTTDSLRDFIISLDKDKADKLRYKIEDNFVRIFISPYHSALSEKDFVYTMGDFNVDVVLALGIVKREELDQVIIEQGRILHDATIVTVNTTTPSSLGTINWNNAKASSLCEMLVDLSNNLKVEKLLDSQIANALLSGIIEETAQFSNDKTSSETMSAGSRLLAAGANQQLVSKEVLSGNNSIAKPIVKANTGHSETTTESSQTTPMSNGALQIDHPVVESSPAPKQPVAKTTNEHPITPGHAEEQPGKADDSDFGLPDVSDDIDQIPIAPISNTPIMTHHSVVMGQPTPSAAVPLKPVEALNAQPVDLTKDNSVDAPKLDHSPQNVSDVDYGAGSNIEFSDPVAPPPVPPPIISK
ncbi:MAG TPA: hypothetical protein VII94_02805 [Candidatus Saccharimonadales bacterium]